MEVSVRSFILFASVVFTGLSAGLFYAWSVSVIPGTKNLTHPVYLQTMQSINRAIQNPVFFIVFFGSILFLSIASIYEFHTSKMAFWLMLSASILYVVGTVGVTALGNVPLNNELDVIELGNMTADKATEFRKYYESNWNRLHQVRTIFAVISFLLSILAIFTSAKS